MKSLLPIVGIAAAIVAAALITLAASGGSVAIAGVPLFALCIAVAFSIQWIAFVPAYLLQTEHFFDLTGSVTYLLLVIGAVLLGPGDPRSLLLATLVAFWAIRLGTFLFARIRRDGEDRRFRTIKPDLATFLMTWTLQGLWVSLTLSCALAAMTAQRTVALDAWAVIGALGWLAGFAIEVRADAEKRRFRSIPENASGFISTGLWAWSRHPNYFGEILLWAGIAAIAWPVLAGWQMATLISPLFVWVLLTRVSGIRMLEARAERRWKDDPDYQAYKSRTPVLFPRRPVG